jgi:HTH-type transcriptional regulator, transcriptional repressor of NAD biosynthesis genes
MVRAFVFGKFLPFHVGHEAMMRFALQQCDFLSVMVCCSDREEIPCHTRAAWIRETFADEVRVEVVEYCYAEDALPNTSVSSRAVSEAWSKVFKELFPSHSLLVTSEPYGDMVAQSMGIRHLYFDPEKRIHPISATHIRSNPFVSWKYLPASVRPYYAMKVAVLGTESTGKTTLALRLADHFHCSLVLEAARDIIIDSKAFSLADLYAVAEEHTRRIDQAIRKDCGLIMVDTDIHITQSYAHHLFGQALDLPEHVYATQKAALYLYLCNDAAYEQDGTRLLQDERDALDQSHRDILREAGITPVELRGGWEERFQKAVAAVNRLLHNEESAQRA